MNRATIGCTWNSKNALRKIVKPYRIMVPSYHHARQLRSCRKRRLACQ
jgi:hypothetical protein